MAGSFTFLNKPVRNRRFQAQRKVDAVLRNDNLVSGKTGSATPARKAEGSGSGAGRDVPHRTAPVRLGLRRRLPPQLRSGALPGLAVAMSMSVRNVISDRSLRNPADGFGGDRSGYAPKERTERPRSNSGGWLQKCLTARQNDGLRSAPSNPYQRMAKYFAVPVDPGRPQRHWSIEEVIPGEKPKPLGFCGSKAAAEAEARRLNLYGRSMASTEQPES
jgi:hypothetical protein